MQPQCKVVGGQRSRLRESICVTIIQRSKMFYARLMYCSDFLYSQVRNYSDRHQLCFFKNVSNEQKYQATLPPRWSISHKIFGKQYFCSECHHFLIV